MLIRLVDWLSARSDSGKIENPGTSNARLFCKQLSVVSWRIQDFVRLGRIEQCQLIHETRGLTELFARCPEISSEFFRWLHLPKQQSLLDQMPFGDERVALLNELVGANKHAKRIHRDVTRSRRTIANFHS